MVLTVHVLGDIFQFALKHDKQHFFPSTTTVEFGGVTYALSIERQQAALIVHIDELSPQPAESFVTKAHSTHWGCWDAIGIAMEESLSPGKHDMLQDAIGNLNIYLPESKSEFPLCDVTWMMNGDSHGKQIDLHGKDIKEKEDEQAVELRPWAHRNEWWTKIGGKRVKHGLGDVFIVKPKDWEHRFNGLLLCIGLIRDKQQEGAGDPSYLCVQLFVPSNADRTNEDLVLNEYDQDQILDSIPFERFDFNPAFVAKYGPALLQADRMLTFLEFLGR